MLSAKPGGGNPQHACQLMACQGILLGTHSLGKEPRLHCYNKDWTPCGSPGAHAWQANILQVKVEAFSTPTSPGPKTLPTPVLDHQCRKQPKSLPGDERETTKEPKQATQSFQHSACCPSLGLGKKHWMRTAMAGSM